MIYYILHSVLPFMMLGINDSTDDTRITNNSYISLSLEVMCIHK